MPARQWGVWNYPSKATAKEAEPTHNITHIPKHHIALQDTDFGGNVHSIEKTLRVVIHRLWNSLRTDLRGRHQNQITHSTDVSTVPIIADTRSQVEILHLFSFLQELRKAPNRTMSMSKGGSPSKEEMRMICSSSFLPRNKGSPVQISYYHWEKRQSGSQERKQHSTYQSTRNREGPEWLPELDNNDSECRRKSNFPCDSNFQSRWAWYPNHWTQRVKCSPVSHHNE